MDNNKPEPVGDLISDNPWSEDNIIEKTRTLVFFKSGRFVHPDEVISLHNAYEDGKEAQRLHTLQQFKGWKSPEESQNDRAEAYVKGVGSIKIAEEIIKTEARVGYVKLDEILEFIKGYTDTRWAQNTHYNENEGLARLRSVLFSKYTGGLRKTGEK
jgi:hypothetical protein